MGDGRLRKLIVVGAGGMASNIVDCFDLEDKISHYFDIPKIEGEEIYGIPVIPLIQNDTNLISVIGDTRQKRNLVAKAILSGATGQSWINLIHDDTFILKTVTYGHGVVIQPNTNIYSRVKIGGHVLICGGTRIGHNTQIGDYCTLCPEVAIAGGVTLGEGVFVGINATIKDNIKVGKGATIGAGAVVVNDVPENWMMTGNPAKRLKGNITW